MNYRYSREGLLLSLVARIDGGPNLIQVISGPRQVGKTTAIKQFLAGSKVASIYDTADLIAPPDATWIEGLWKEARGIARRDGRAILVLDEVQKVPRWSEAVKRLHDEDHFGEVNVRVIILGSSSLLVQKGLNESLAGRFEITHFKHWSLAECRAAFGFDLDEYIFFGGYPGAAALLLGSGRDELRWQQYVREALVEPVIGKDILMLSPVEKPSLLRQVFQLACAHPAEILAYIKMLGQLQEAGNATTVATYLGLLAAAGIVEPLAKHSGSAVRRRASSPKLVVLDNALVNAVEGRSLARTRKDPAAWGRLVENAVGAHLCNRLATRGAGVFYWRQRGDEVDYVVRLGGELVGIEVKSGREKRSRGAEPFLKRFPGARFLTVGDEACTLESFLAGDPVDLIAAG